MAELPPPYDIRARRNPPNQDLARAILDLEVPTQTIVDVAARRGMTVAKLSLALSLWLAGQGHPSAAGLATQLTRFSHLWARAHHDRRFD